MARYTGPVCKLCRRENMKLFLKGERCYGDKCAYTRWPYSLGQHGQGRIKLSEYAVRLREKQKVRRIYGVLERQFRAYYTKASHSKGRTGEEMIALLESRLDNFAHRCGFASTRKEGRHLVQHAHVLVNGKTVNIPSYQLKPGDKVSIHERSRKIPYIAAAMAASDRRPVMSWVELDKENFVATFKTKPVRDELNEPAIREQLIVEYYSR